jgi:hypothetical protein
MPASAAQSLSAVVAMFVLRAYTARLMAVNDEQTKGEATAIAF